MENKEVAMEVSDISINHMREPIGYDFAGSIRIEFAVQPTRRNQRQRGSRFAAFGADQRDIPYRVSA